MAGPVDLTDLRTMTDGDPELELVLFDEFCSSGKRLIQTMADHSADGAAEEWRNAAHALKGSAYNVGALALGNLCKQAQDNPEAPQHEKKLLIESIQSEFTQVEAYLKTLHS